MLVKRSISQSEFFDEFNNSQYKNNFSYEWLNALYDYYNDFEEEIDFDIVAIACDWSEYSLDDIQKYYWMDLEELKDTTAVIDLDNDNFLIMDF